MERLGAVKAASEGSARNGLKSNKKNHFHTILYRRHADSFPMVITYYVDMANSNN